MEARNRCGLCKAEASVTKIPGPASLKIIRHFNSNYKGAPLCPKCFSVAKARVEALKTNRENETPNTSSSDSLMRSDTRPETEPTSVDSRSERGESLLAQKGTEGITSFSQPIGSRESSRGSVVVPPFLPSPQPAQSTEPSSTEFPATTAQLEVYTPEYERVQEEPRKRSPERNVRSGPGRKRQRFELSEIEETEELEEDAPPDEVVQQVSGDREEAPIVNVAEEDEDVQEVEISIASSMPPLPRNPRIRDADLRTIMERSQSLVNRGQEIVNNMPRTHAG